MKGGSSLGLWRVSDFTSQKNSQIISHSGKKYAISKVIVNETKRRSSKQHKSLASRVRDDVGGMVPWTRTTDYITISSQYLRMCCYWMVLFVLRQTCLVDEER